MTPLEFDALAQFATGAFCLGLVLGSLSSLLQRGLK